MTRPGGLGFAIVRGVPAKAGVPSKKTAQTPLTLSPAPVQPKPAPVTASTGIARLTVSPQGPVQANSTIEVTWSAGSKLHFQSFIAIVDPGQPRSGRMPRYYRRKLIGRSKTGTWRAKVPGKAGKFELRLFDPWNRKTITSISLTVKPASTASQGKVATGNTSAQRPSAGNSAGSRPKSCQHFPCQRNAATNAQFPRRLDAMERTVIENIHGADIRQTAGDGQGSGV